MLRRIPRFGMLTLSAVMLLCVSAAGWVKFHQDLLKEEEELFAALSEADCNYAYRRYENESYGPLVAGVPVAANAAPVVGPDDWAFLRRVETVTLDPVTPRELLERAARLPYVREVHAPVPTEGPNRSVVTIVRRIGLDVATLAPTPDETPSLPRGEPVDDEEAADVIDKLRREWASQSPAPPDRGILYFGSEPQGWCFVFEGGHAMLISPGDIEIAAEDRFDVYTRMGNRLAQTGRHRNPELAFAAAEDFKRLAHRQIQKPHENLDDALDDAWLLTSSAPRAAASEPIAFSEGDYRIERVDDTRYRIEFPAVTALLPLGSTAETRASAVVRSNFDWEPEAYDLHYVQRPADPNADGAAIEEATLHYRGLLRREGDRVVVASWFEDKIDLSALPSLKIRRQYGSFSSDLPTGFDLASIDAEALGAEPLPPPRKLPWLPWHHATLAISLALLGFAAARNGASRLRRRAGEVTPPSPNRTSAAYESEPNVASEDSAE